MSTLSAETILARWRARLAAAGRKGGKSRSAKKLTAARKNGLLGGCNRQGQPDYKRGPCP